MREERKVVTALFADMVGSTELTERLDPEDAREVLGASVRRMVEAVEAMAARSRTSPATGSWHSSERRSPTRTTPSARSAQDCASLRGRRAR